MPVLRKTPIKDSLEGITKPSLKRLARRAGIKRLSTAVYPETKEALVVWLDKVLADGSKYAEHAHRRTITVMDIMYALKRNGQTLYGYKHR